MDLGSAVRFLMEYWVARRAQKMSPAALLRLRTHRWKRFCSGPLLASPFYRRLLEGHDLGSLPNGQDALPRFDKGQLLDHFTEWNVFGMTETEALDWGNRGEAERDFSPLPNGLSVGLSSGTTGRRGIFLTTPEERLRWAAVVLARFLPRFWRKRHRIALFLRANSPLYETLGSKRIEFRYFDLIRPFQELVTELIDYQPTVLFGPPSVLAGLAAAIGDRGLEPPELVISGAEVLEPEVKDRLTRAFRCPVKEIYQATEGFLAYTCSAGRLHWNEDYLIIEKQYLPDPSPHENHRRYIPVVTDMARTSQPIFRYRMNDIITEDPRSCPCGCSFGILLRIEGREDDVFCLRGAQGFIPLFPDFLRRAIGEAHLLHGDYQMVQASMHRIEVYVNGLDQVLFRACLDTLWKALRVEVPELVFAPYTPPPPEKKFRRLVRRFPLPPGFWSR